MKSRPPRPVHGRGPHSRFFATQQSFDTVVVFRLPMPGSGQELPANEYQRKNPAELPLLVEQRGRNREEASTNEYDRNRVEKAVKRKRDIFEKVFNSADGLFVTANSRFFPVPGRGGRLRQSNRSSRFLLPSTCNCRRSCPPSCQPRCARSGGPDKPRTGARPRRR